MLPGERRLATVLVGGARAHGDERVATAGAVAELGVGELDGNRVDVADDDEAGRDRQAVGEAGERRGLAARAPHAARGGILEPEDRLVPGKQVNGAVHDVTELHIAPTRRK